MKENKKLKRELKTFKSTLAEIRSAYNKELRVSRSYADAIKNIAVKLDIAYKTETLDSEKLYALMELCEHTIRIIEKNETNYKGT